MAQAITYILHAYYSVVLFVMKGYEIQSTKSANA